MTHLNNTVLVSDANNFSIEAPINPHYGFSPLDKTKSILEHQTVVELFKQASINVIQAPSPLNCQDGIYTANWALVRGNRAVLSRLPNVRKNEEEYAKNTLKHLGKTIVHIPDNYKFSGQGDALACGNYLLAGSGYRSDPEAQSFAASQLGYELVQLQTVAQIDKSGRPVINKVTGWPDSLYYDIDLAIAVIRDDLIAYCPEAFTPESVEKIQSLNIETIEVSRQEAEQGFACNLVSTGETIIMSDQAPELASALAARGFVILTTPITELSKGGGYIRCISLALD